MLQFHTHTEAAWTHSGLSKRSVNWANHRQPQREQNTREGTRRLATSLPFQSNSNLLRPCIACQQPFHIREPRGASGRNYTFSQKNATAQKSGRAFSIIVTFNLRVAKHFCKYVGDLSIVNVPTLNWGIPYLLAQWSTFPLSTIKMHAKAALLRAFRSKSFARTWLLYCLFPLPRWLWCLLSNPLPFSATMRDAWSLSTDSISTLATNITPRIGSLLYFWSLSGF